MAEEKEQKNKEEKPKTPKKEEKKEEPKKEIKQEKAQEKQEDKREFKKGRNKFQGKGKRKGRYNSSKSREKKDDFDSNLLDLTRVERMTSGGRRLRFRAVIVIGDRKGKVGLGVAKGVDVAQAVEKATRIAKKSIIEVPIIDGTIPFEAEAKFGAARILIRPQRKGKGLIAGGTVRVMCSLVGIEDISSKVLSKSRNKINNAKATLLAFKKLKAKRKKRS